MATWSAPLIVASSDSLSPWTVVHPSFGLRKSSSPSVTVVDDPTDFANPAGAHSGRLRYVW